VASQFVIHLKTIKTAGLALAVGLAFFLFSSTSQASCGDYVMPGKKLVAAMDPHQPLQAPDDHSSNHAPKKGTCHGCSKGSDRIPATPTNLITPIRDQWLIGLSSLILSETQSRAFAIPENTKHYVHLSFRIERPPRLLSL
jgi:hypothetical protein